MRECPCSCARSQLGPLGARHAGVCNDQTQVASCRKVRLGVSCRVIALAELSHTSARVRLPCQPLAWSRAGGLSIGRHGALRVLVS
jgi:hypothetical protein